MGELREDSLVRSYEFTDDFFDSQPTPTSSSPPQPVTRPRALSASQEMEPQISSEPKPRVSTGSLNISPEVLLASQRRKKLTPDDPSRQLWPISRASQYHATPSGLPLVTGTDLPGRKESLSFASPLVQTSCRSNSMCVVSERRNSSSLRSPSPVLLKGKFFSYQLESSSVDSIIDEITTSATKGISRLKQEHTGSTHSRQSSSLLEPPVSSEGGSSSLDLSDSLYDDGDVTIEEPGSTEGRRLDGRERSTTAGSVRNSMDGESSWKGVSRGQGAQLSNR